jgi:hypothetical protein
MEGDGRKWCLLLNASVEEGGLEEVRVLGGGAVGLDDHHHAATARQMKDLRAKTFKKRG